MARHKITRSSLPRTSFPFPLPLLIVTSHLKLTAARWKQEEAARNYVPPPPKKTEPTPSAPTETLKPAATTTTTAHTNGKPMPAPLALVTSTNTASKSPAYIDPKTGLPSPTQPTIHLVDDSNVIGDVDSSRVVTGNTTTGKSPRTGGSVKKSAQ
jgi:hypothetical protein